MPGLRSPAQAIRAVRGTEKLDLTDLTRFIRQTNGVLCG